MSEFVLNVRCDKCRAIFRTDAHDANFYNAFESNVCASCGHHGFHDSVERYVNEAELLKPWTWLSGHWEKAE
ncbi:hypothetical protein [Halomonas sp. Mc5H-6]|uniref:hypothetical protein n=1 Tax=Halomonas sp. Mc5H-6 TaxID=2954500 RepID=UPI002097647D|nr:hypothetical protein [Halomonas sp. Mc5H-6]MCO7246390.1 hypothetical protein [Halomonas sp. Mc5H-6]